MIKGSSIKKRLLSILLIIILIIPNVDTALAMGGNQETDAIEEGQNPVVDEEANADPKSIEPLEEQTNMEDLISDLPEENMPQEGEKQNPDEALNLEESQSPQTSNDKIQSHIDNTRSGNITDKVVITGLDLSIEIDGNKQFIIKDSEKVPGAPEIKEGDIIKLDYYWEIPAGNMPVEEGSVFEIELPDKDFVYVKNTVDVNDLIDGNTTFKIGVWKVEDGIIIVTLNKTGADSQGISNGYFELTGKADVAGKDISINGD
ncbi:MAG TPA: hypothetical protein IAC62_03380, partial [Candidatus Pelethocola excrementipullorum]|nr:hypothetical protein [Candidatus Pelethocola excrementipullorum]